MIKKQEELFIVENITCADKINIGYYEYIITKENNIHNRIMKDKEIELTKIKYQNIDKEIELIKAQIELELIKSNQTKSTIIKNCKKHDIIKL